MDTQWCKAVSPLAVLLASLITLLMALAPVDLGARTWYILPDGTGDAPTIDAGLTVAIAGDTVLVACGLYHEYQIELRSGVVLRSETGQPECVTIDAQQQGLVLWADEWSSDVVVEGLTLSGGHNPFTRGGALEAVLSGVVLRDCHIIGNAGTLGGGVASVEGGGIILQRCLFANNEALNGNGGALAVGGGAQVSECVFQDNTASAGGGAVSLSGFGTIMFETCVFTGNSSSGGSAVGCFMTMNIVLNRCTFVGNVATDGQTGVIFNLDGGLSLQNCLIAFNAGASVTGGVSQMSCTDIYQNSGGDWVMGIAEHAGVNGNFSADPCFCDAGALNFSLCADSWCLPENSLWGCSEVVGALGQGCVACDCPPPLPVDRWTWGRVKAQYE